MHLASLAGLPVVALFGPTDPVENEPFPGIASRRVRVDVGCNPCREGCPVLSCMRAIEPESVVQAVRELVAAGSGVD
jgi:ADP-heptose:LPS heptosyltransferase